LGAEFSLELAKQEISRCVFAREISRFLEKGLSLLYGKNAYKVNIQQFNAEPNDSFILPDVVITPNKGKRIKKISVSCIWHIYNHKQGYSGYANLLGNQFSIATVITSEIVPSKLALLVFGIPGLSSVYHIALPEFLSAYNRIGNEDQLDMLGMMIKSHQLRDISDLPFDLTEFYD
jgi:hypothetical protein